MNFNNVYKNFNFSLFEDLNKRPDVPGKITRKTKTLSDLVYPRDLGYKDML